MQQRNDPAAALTLTAAVALMLSTRTARASAEVDEAMRRQFPEEYRGAR